MAALNIYDVLASPLMHYFRMIWNFCACVNRMFVYIKELQTGSLSCLYLFVILITLELMDCQSYTCEVLNGRKHGLMQS